MRWDYGKIYKEIRKSKGLTQEEICGDFLARSTLARIESGQVVPKFDTMIFLLRQIDMPRILSLIVTNLSSLQ